MPFEHPITIYYEDTDFSGAVYHANYLKYFERAREHALGIQALRDLWSERIGFVVYKAELTFKEAARHGDELVIVTTAERESSVRLVFDQRCRRRDSTKDLVVGRLELVCVQNDRLIALPEPIVQAVLRAQG